MPFKFRGCLMLIDSGVARYVQCGLCLQSIPLLEGGQCNQSDRGRQAIGVMKKVRFLPCVFIHAVLAVVLFTVMGGPAPLWAASLPGGGQQQEYFVRQQAGEGLLIRINGREAQFESQVLTIEDELVLVSQVPGSRLAPLFQYIPPTDRSRQLDVKVTAPLDTNRSTFEMGLSRIDVRDDRSARLAQGYEWLSFGLQLPAADTTGNWSIKVNSLLNAARTFNDFGMVELELWSTFLAAQITLAKLGDYNAALLLSEEIFGHPATRRNADLSLATMKLRLEAMLYARRAGELAARGVDADPLQRVASESAALATRLGNQFERGEALYLAGVDFAERGMEPEALDRFEQALALAVSIEADDLATRVREDMVAIHGSRGDVAASSQVLQAIESQLTEDGADDELAQNLLAQGRIFNRTYRYREAQQVLRQALEFEHNSLTRSQVRLELAVASYALGDLDDAYAQARSAVTRAGDGSFRRATSVLDVGRGMNIMAGVQRARGERSAMQQTRDAQRAYLETSVQKTQWAWERAQDELAFGRSSSAAPWLRQVGIEATTAQAAPYRQLARLWLCRLGSDCTSGTARAAYDALGAIEIPRYRVSGTWAYAGWLANSGQRAAALEAYESLLDELIFLRFSVPGVLGDWYWRRSLLLVEDALELLRANGDPERHLLGLARAQWLSATADDLGMPFDATSAGLDRDAFRASLADRELPGPGVNSSEVNAGLAAEFGRGRLAFREAMGFLGDAGLKRWLEGLEQGEAVLAFDLEGKQVYALLGTRSGVQRLALGTAAEFSDWPELLRGAERLGDESFAAQLDTWGQRLLEPLDGRLPERVYLAASGTLAAAPFEAMTVRGKRSFERRQLVRLASFPARPGAAERLQPSRSPGVFLAGQPQDFSPGFLERLDAGRELQTVMDVFRGPGLIVIQGSALLPDEFATPQMQSAGLLHMAMPARMNLSQPSKSYLELSEAYRAAGRSRETPRDIADWTLDAFLVVMGQGTLENANRAAAGRMPLVADFLAVGAQSVLASVWARDDAQSAAFFERFYRSLNEGGSPLEALTLAQQEMIDGDKPARDWAAYQLWID